jgi:hypothetical protein
VFSAAGRIAKAGLWSAWQAKLQLHLGLAKSFHLVKSIYPVKSFR